MSMCDRTAAFVVVLSGLTGHASAAISDFANFKVRMAEQTSAAPVTEFLSYFGNQRFFGSDLTEENLGVALVSSEATGSRTLDPITGGQFAVAFLSTVGTEAELDAALPAGEYTFELDGGLFGPGSATLNQPETNLWSSVPCFTNWSELQGALPDLPLTVTYDTAVIDESIDRGGVFWSVRNISTDAIVASGFNKFAEPGVFTIDGGLAPNTEYEIFLDFSARIAQGFGSGALESVLGEVGFDTIVTIRFTTVPTPGALALLPLAGLVSLRRRR